MTSVDYAVVSPSSSSDLPGSVLHSLTLLLGWQNKRHLIANADQAEDALLQTFEEEYAEYLASPNSFSASKLYITLSDLINYAKKQRDAALRLSARFQTLSHNQSSLSGMLYTLLGLGNSRQLRYYDTLAAKYESWLDELVKLRDNISQTQHSQRRLLQKDSASQPVCYGFGSFTSTLSNTQTGFELGEETLANSIGYSVSPLGDFNGDGLSDFVVGAPDASAGAGRVYIIFGSTSTTSWGTGIVNVSSLMNGQRGFVVQGEIANDQAGYAVSSAGDFNGDGLADVLIGAPAVALKTGKTYIIFGSRNTSAWGDGAVPLASLMNGKNGVALLGKKQDVWSGFFVGLAGDINGDGYSDVLIGAPSLFSPYLTSPGEAYLIFGANESSWVNGTISVNNLIDGKRGFILEGEIPKDEFGRYVGSAGDLNSDGFADFLIGAPAAASSAGRVYLVFGTNNYSRWKNGSLMISTLMNGVTGWGLQGEPGSKFGVPGSADVNGDGIPDILVGAPLALGRAGKCYIVFGRNNTRNSGVINVSSLMDGILGFSLEGELADDGFCSSVGNAGDINDDSIDDLLIGAPLAAKRAGTTYTIFGSRDTKWGNGTLNIKTAMDKQYGFAMSRKGGDDGAGYSVSTAGDINGDGVSDFLVGAPGSSQISRCYIILGKSSALYFTANTLALDVAETVQLNSKLLAVASRHSDRIDLNALVVNVSNVENGYFAFNCAPTKHLTQFYMQNITEGSIRFVHTGGSLAPRYVVSIDAVPGISSRAICSGVEVTFFNNLMPNQFTYVQQLDQLGNLTHSQVCVGPQICTKDLIGRAGFTIQGETGDSSGFWVSSAGDFNGDGYSDILVTAPYAPITKTYLLFGDPESTSWGSSDFSRFMDGYHGFTLMGESVSSTEPLVTSGAGDINGDSFADILIGDPAVGKAYLVFGWRDAKPEDTSSFNLVDLMDGQRGFMMYEGAGSECGSAVSSAGDFNGDGVSDFMVGSPSKLGKTYVIFGSEEDRAWSGKIDINSLMDGKRGFVVHGESSGDAFGSALNVAGDLNGDGLSDILLGAFYASEEAGKVYVIFGHRNETWNGGSINISTVMDGTHGFSVQGEFDGDWFGFSVSTAGDVNGDGLSDLLVGAPRASLRAGKGYIIFGSRNATAWGNGEVALSDFMDGRRGFELYTADPAAADDQAGSGVSSAGDFNGDGLDDIILGAPLSSSFAGKSYMIFGSRNSTAWADGTLDLQALMQQQRGFVLLGEASSRAGWSVDMAGDFNGDGLADILIGAYSASFKAGKSYVIFGAAFPLYFTANSITLGVSETIPLTLEHLNVATTRPWTDVGAIVISVQGLQNGYFFFNGTEPRLPITRFLMRDVWSGSIHFVHTGGALAPRYTVTIEPVQDVSQNPTHSDSAVMFLGYRPTLVYNRLNVNQGIETLIEPSDLSANDQDDSPDNIFFLICNLTHGQFNLYNATGITRDIAKFSQQDIFDRRVQFLHNGSPHPPSYNVVVTDTKSHTDYSPAIIAFNYAPELTLNSIILDQGQPTTLRSLDIVALDNETFSEELVIEVSNCTFGHFAYANNPGADISRFRQLALITSTVQFIQNGSDSTPTFFLRAYDGTLYSDWRSSSLLLNHRPLVVYTISDQTVIEDDDFDFLLDHPNLFVDPDHNDNLTFSAQQVGGTPLPPEIFFEAFYPLRIHGNLPTSQQRINIEILARDSRLVTNSTTFWISAKMSNWTRYKDYWATVSGIAGAALTLLTYLWIRKKIAQHRRDFAFANYLRRAVNLEYHDFMRFDGDTYKTRTSEFLIHLHAERQHFYSHLRLQEQQSFAVCVGEILVRRKLVAPSGYASGCYGLLLLLSRGWPLEIDLKEFETQSQQIAREALIAWDECAEPLVRWPYSSFSMREKLKAVCCSRPSNAGKHAASFALKRSVLEPTVLEDPVMERQRRASSCFEVSDSPFMALPIEPGQTSRHKRAPRGGT